MSELVLPNVAAGEAGAPERCLDRYGALVWSLARRYFASRADAEDAVQEAFVALWENASRFDPNVASETTFVAMISRRRMIDLVRRRVASNTVGAAGGPERVEVESLAAAEQSPRVELTEEAQRVREHMQSLREEERRVLDLALCQGLTQQRIAELTGWPLGTVKSHARRGMTRLRGLLSAPTKRQPPIGAGEGVR
ncbi:MAG: sigma-70 family RNA polymerase sigma factor [Lacipirellulaceae bacterium]